MKDREEYINILEIDKAELTKENQELKSQFEERTKMYQNAYDYSQKIEGKAIILETQQKEFINYLNSYIDLLNDKPDMLEETQKDILEEILQKYKSIIGENDV